MGSKLTLINHGLSSPKDGTIDKSWPQRKSDLNLI